MMETEQNDDEFTMEQMWTLFSYLLKYDLGTYGRYDIDHKNTRMGSYIDYIVWIYV